jgi:hypothetical protein
MKYSLDRSQGGYFGEGRNNLSLPGYEQGLLGQPASLLYTNNNFNEQFYAIAHILMICDQQPARCTLVAATDTNLVIRLSFTSDRRELKARVIHLNDKPCAVG